MTVERNLFTGISPRLSQKNRGVRINCPALIAGLAGFLVVGLVSVYETSADETTIAVTGDSTELVHDADHGIDDIYFSPGRHRKMPSIVLKAGRLTQP